MNLRAKKAESEIKDHSARIANIEQHVILIYETEQRILEEIQQLKECNCKLDRNIEAKIESLKQRDQREGYEKDYHEGHEPQDGFVDPDYEDNLSDAEADSQTLASAGWGTDEDYGGTDDRL